MLAYNHGTANAAGLHIKASPIEQVDEKGIKVAQDVFETMNIQNNYVRPRWNYTIRPQPM